MASAKQERRRKIHGRIRNKISGTGERPRMSVFRSNKNIFVQLIDDVSGKTLASASSLVKEISEKKDINKSEQSALVGKAIAEKVTALGIKEIIFDRGGYLYHGRVKALAEAARENGLKF